MLFLFPFFQHLIIFVFQDHYKQRKKHEFVITVTRHYRNKFLAECCGNDVSQLEKLRAPNQ